MVSLLSLRAMATPDEWNERLAVEVAVAREGRQRRAAEAMTR